ncbi:ERAP1-like C-terminal domain-containing protein, partial [Streptomyces sp. NPDC001139]
GRRGGSRPPGEVTTHDGPAPRSRRRTPPAEPAPARCRAALPDEAGKAKAWEAMFGSDDLSNYLFIATAQGFWQPEQADLVGPYVARYYEDAVAVSARRGPAIADAAGRSAFPVHAVDAETLRLGEACLRDADLLPALRRKLVDQLDDLRRALRVREG